MLKHSSIYAIHSLPEEVEYPIKTPIKADIRSLDPSGSGKIDLIIFSNVLNELPDITMDVRADIDCQLNKITPMKIEKIPEI